MAELRNIADKRVVFEQIYRDYSKPMFLYALSFLTSEEEAEDVIQEVFVNFWKDETYRKVKGEVTKTYLFRSVKNNCLNRLKKKDVLRDRLDLLREDIVEEEIMKWNDELIQEVESEIDRMPEQTKLIIRGVFFREMKYNRRMWKSLLPVQRTFPTVSGRKVLLVLLFYKHPAIGQVLF